MQQRPPMGLMQPPVQPPVMNMPPGQGGIQPMPPIGAPSRGMPFEGNMPGPGKFGPNMPMAPTMLPPQQQVANALAQQRMGGMGQRPMMRNRPMAY